MTSDTFLADTRLLDFTGPQLSHLENFYKKSGSGAKCGI